jgi:serine/threonine protein kinase
MSGPEQFDETHMITLSGAESGPHSAISLSRQLKRGDVIGGSYKLLSLIGQGGMGYVFCAEHTMIKRLYALKILAPELLSEANSKRFEVEGRAIANLDHVNIVKVHNMGLDSDNCPFYVMDLLQGQALSDCVGSGLLSVDDALDILTQIAAGLGYAHGKGIVHRDIKPSNVILTNENDRVIVKIVDFGIAKLLPSASLQGQSQTTTGEVVGSPLYMSPEQCMSGAIDERTDIYSLGCTFYEMVAGVPPFKGASALETVLMHQQAPVPKIADLLGARIQGRLARASVPVEYLDVLIEGMLAKRQEDRYESMARLLHDLERLACGKPIGLAGELLTTDLNNCGSELDSVSGSGQDTHARGWTKKQLVAFSLAGAALIGTAAGIVGLTVLGQRSDVVGPEAVQKMPPVIQPIAQPLANAIRKKVTVNPNFSEDSGGKYLAVDDIEEAVKKKSGSDAKQFEAAYEKSGPIVSTTVVVGREKCRMFEFPKCTMGDISTSHGNVVNACGRALVPYYPPLYLNIGAAPGSAIVFDYPDILSKIGPDEFDGLTIVGKKNDALGGSFGGSTPQSVSLAAAVAKVRTWTKLTRVGVKYGNLNTNLLSAIDKLPHLNEFEVCKTTGQPEALLKAPFMSRVTSFIVRRQYNYRSVFEKLKDLKSLKRLAVIACELNKEDLELFASYRNIDNFFISNHFRSLEDSVNADVQAMSTVTPDEIVDVIRRMKSLSRVSIGEIKLNQAQLLVLTSCPNLKKIILTGTKYTSAERAQLSAQQPKIDFAEADRG